MDKEDWRDRVEAGKKALLAYQKKKKAKKKKSGTENLPEGQSKSSGADESTQSLISQSLDDLADDYLEVWDPLSTGGGSGPVAEIPSQPDNQDAVSTAIQGAFSSPLPPSDSGLGIPSTGEMSRTQLQVKEVFNTDTFLDQEQPLYHDGSDATQVQSQFLEQSQAESDKHDAENEMRLQIDALHASYAEKMDSYRKQVEEAANAQVKDIYASLQENLQVQQKQSQEAQLALLSRLDKEQSLRKEAEEKIAALEEDLRQNAGATTMTPSMNDDAEQIRQKLHAVSSERDCLRNDVEAARRDLELTIQASADEKAQMHAQLAEQIEEVKKSSFTHFEAQLQAVTMRLEEAERREAQIRSSFDAQQSDLMQKSQDSAMLAQECQKLSEAVKQWESHVKELKVSHTEEIRDLQQDFENRLADAKASLEAEHQTLVNQVERNKEDSLKPVILKLEKQLEEERLQSQELKAVISQLHTREAQVVDLEETNEGLVSQLESLNHRLEEAEMHHRTLSGEKEALLLKHADVVQTLKRQQLEIEEGIQACNEVQQQKHQLELEVQSLQAALKAQAVPMHTLTSSEASADNCFNLLSLKVDSALQRHLHHIGFDFEAGPESLFANLGTFIHAKSQEVADLELEMKKQHVVAEKTIQELSAENATLKQDIASLHHGSVNAQSKLHVLTEGRSALESSLMRQRGVLEQKLAERDSLEQQLKHQRAELDQRQARQSHLEAVLEEKSRLEQELQAQRNTLLNSLSSIQEKLNLSEEDALQQQRQWEEERAKTQSTLRQKDEALSQQQNEFKLQQVTLTTQYDGYIHKLQEDHSRQVTTIQEDAATSLKQQELQLVHHHQDEVGRLTSQHNDDMQDMRKQHSQELAKKDELLEQLEVKLTESDRAMALMQKESQQQAEAALVTLQQSLNAAHLEEVRKVKEELSREREIAVEDLTKQCHAARDEYNQLKASCEQEFLALQEQLQVSQEAAKTAEAAKLERDEALRQLHNLSQTRESNIQEMKQSLESQLQALQVQHALEVKQLQHELNQAQLAKKDELLEQLEAKLADAGRAMALMQKESQQQAEAALVTLQQSLNAAHLEEVRKVKEELSREKEIAVEDLTKQCHAAHDEYNQLKSSCEQECLALQEQLEVLQETAKTVEAAKIERDSALRQLHDLSQTRESNIQEMKQSLESQLQALQVQHALEVKKLQHELNQAQARIEELRLFNEKQTLAQTKLQAEVTEKTAECARLTELSVIAASRSEDETQRNNEVFLLRKDNEDLQNQLSVWKEKVSSFQEAVAIYEQKVSQLHELATDVDDVEELDSNGSTTSESSSIEEHSLLEPSMQTLQDTAQFATEQLQPDDTTLQSGFVMDISKGSLSMEATGLDLMPKLERIQQVMMNVARRTKELVKKDELLEQLEAKLADAGRAMALMQKESQQQAEAALVTLQQSLNAAHLEEVRKVKEELSREKEIAVEDLTKQCHAAHDEYNQLKSSCEQECLALQEQLEVLQETAKTVEAAKIERDSALRQLHDLSQTRESNIQEMKQSLESQLQALQVQHALEVKQLQHELNQAQARIEELRLFNEKQTLAQTKLQAEVTEKTAECARLTELSVIAANRSEDETQRNNEVVLLRKDNEELQNQLSAWKEKVSSFQEAVAIYEQKVSQLHQLAADVDDAEELDSNGSTTSESSSIEEHSLLELSMQTLQDTAQFATEQPQPDDTTLQSGLVMDISKGSLSMESTGLDLMPKLERIQQVMMNVARRTKELVKKDQLLEQLEVKLAESDKAMALMQKESQQQAEATLVTLQQSLNAAHLEEVRKVKEELSREKEIAVEDLTKQCHAARDEYNQLKASCEQEFLALQEQLQVSQEAAKTAEAAKLERDEALRQLHNLSQTRESNIQEMKQSLESQLQALQVQHALEVKRLQHELNQAQDRVTELDTELKSVTNQMEGLLEHEKKEKQLLSTQLASVVAEKEQCLQEMSELHSKLQSLEQGGGDFALLESENYAVVDLHLLNRIIDLAPSLRSEAAEVHALSDLKDSSRETTPSALERELAGLVQRMQEALANCPQDSAELHDWRKDFLDAINEFLRKECHALSMLIARTGGAPNVPTGKEYSDLLSHLEAQTENMRALHQADRTALLAKNQDLKETVASLQKGHTDQLSGLQAQFAKASEMAHSLENACAEQKALRQEKDRLAEDLNEMKSALQVEKMKYRDLNDRFVQKEQEMQQQALKIGQELSKKHTELNRCTRELVAARNDNIRLQEELNSQQLELQSTLSQLAAIRSQGLTQQEEYGRLQAKLRQCQRDLSSAREHGGQWQEQVQQQQSELNRTSEDLRSAQREIADLKRQVRLVGIHHSPFLGVQSTSYVPEDAWQEPPRAGSGRVVKGSLLLSSTEGPAHMTGLEGMESGIHSATQSLCQMKAELSRIHALYKKTENQRRALVFQKAYLTQQVDSFYYTQHAALDILQDMHVVDVAALHSRRAVNTPRQHFRAIVWAVIAAKRIHRLFIKHTKP